MSSNACGSLPVSPQDLEISLLVDQFTSPSAHQRVIINEQHLIFAS